MNSLAPRILRLFLLIALLAVVVFPSKASPSRDPKRVVGGRSVDLTPLFQWWNQKNGDRPLSAWVHVSGEIVGTNAGSWIIEAQTEEPAEGKSSGKKRILLRNPPMQDRAMFEQLFAQKKALEAQRSGLHTQADQADAKIKDIAQERKVAREQHVRAKGLNAQSSKLKQEEKAAKAELKPIDAQIADLDKKLKPYGDTEHYVIDCFALKTAERVGGLPVFDHGGVFR